ncbi:MAG: helix-turn-helix transcriptional regulator [bacterium]
MKSATGIQEALFQIIKEKLPTHVSFVHELSELLGVSYDSAYRRIRGEKELSFEELRILSDHFRISLDTLFNVNSQNILFNSMAIGEQGFSFGQWLQAILVETKDIHSCKQKEIIYSAKDIPIFHFFEFPDLFAFKSYFWNKVLFSTPGYEQKKFTFEVDEQAMGLVRMILSTYNRIPTIELWNEETFNSLIRQIEFCNVCGYFSTKGDALKVLNGVGTMVSHLEQQAAAGFRFLHGESPEGVEGSYRLYCNEVLLGDNTIFVLKDGRTKTFLTYNVINLLVTENPMFCKQIESSLRNLTKKSTLISSSSEKERQRFFHILTSKINELRGRIQGS